MDEIAPFAAAPLPTAARPFLGLTLLVVEDSRYASEAVRLLCLKSGARIRRADSLRTARRHLAVYRPVVLLVDLGLPDGTGAALIAEMAEARPRIPVLLGMSGDPARAREAASAGADGFLEKPIGSLAAFQAAVLNRLPDRARACYDEAAPEDLRPDPALYRDDLAHAAEIIGGEMEEASLAYLVQFLSGLAESAGDAPLSEAAAALAEARRSGRPAGSPLARVAGLVQERLTERAAI
ncbi:response regulator [Rhodosalinus sp.]|uniref:response regulator n=1 Tax=Rhodosalinus sp. TaxID=2047741 RepID=UPI003567880F